ncbi:MAG: LLM class F420-dependent oxidoreductase [Acidimicrobiia bacterium]|nr:LLM class F420-dependent oxidoreductase [Acidimicrobiia bacterium]
MKLGIITPVVLKRPHAHAPWEDDAGIAEIAMVAEAADVLGYHHLTCSEHVAVPFTAGEMRGAAYWDPLATFGYLAARTEQIRLVTHVLVLGYHHPLEIAKRYGTLDRVCDGRLVLGVGVGTLQEEFELLGAQFEGRGERADDALRALRASLGRREPVYHGEFYDYEGFVVDPWAMQEPVPIWIGGKTARSLRRAVELADGWVPFALTTEQIKDMLARARETEAWQKRDADIEVVLPPPRAVDPLGEPDAARRALEDLAGVGTTIANLTFRTRSPEHYCEQLAAMKELAT